MRILPLIAVAAGLGALAPIHAQQSGLIAHWTFDETGGTIAADATGNGHDGTLKGGARFRRGLLGRALELDGATGVVEVEGSATSPDFDLTGGLSVAAWIRPGDALFATQRMVLSKDGAYELRVDAPSPGRWDLRLNNSSTSPDADTRLVTEAWQHIAVTWNGQRVRYYTNGQPDGGFNFTGALATNGRQVAVGARPGGSSALRGRLDDLRLYGRALAPREIARLHALGPPSEQRPPTISDAAPTGRLPAGSSRAVVSLSTDEEATCRYDVVGGTAYEEMPHLFDATEDTRHSTALTGLEDGRTHAVFVRCIDLHGNVSTGTTPQGDFPVLFSVDRPGFDPKDLDALLFYVESTFFEDPEHRARSIATCATRECFEAPDRLRITLQYCDTVVDRNAVAGARGIAPDGCIRRWEDQSPYQSLRQAQFRGELVTGRDFGQDDHEKPVFVPDCLNGRPCARGRAASSAPIFPQSTSFEIELADAFADGAPAPSGYPASPGLAGPFSIFLLVKPIPQDANWFYFGCSANRGLRHNVHDDSLFFLCGNGGDLPCTTQGKITRPGAVAVNRWQLIEIHRDSADRIRVITNGTDVTRGTPLAAAGRWCFHDVMSRAKGLQAMLGDLAAAVVYDQLVDEAGRRDLRIWFDGIYGYLDAPPSPPDTRPPSKPRNVVASTGAAGRIELSWQASVDDVAVTGYQVFRDDVYLDTAAGTSYSDPGRTPGVAYTYTLRSRDAAGNTSALSNPAVGSTSPPGRDPVPRRGYRARRCGFDMDDDFVYGEPEDCQVGDGVTRDPDGDGVDEDLIYVDCDGGSDTGGDGSANRPFLTLEHAVAVADGPADGAEDIIAFRGTCTPEDLMIELSGVGGVKVRPRSGSEERDFQYPRDPAMIIGWDADDDGIYPPLDADDVSVLAGGGPQCLVRPFHSGGASYRFFEMAHFIVRGYGTCNTVIDDQGQEVAEETGGFFRHRGGSGELYSHHYFHDLKLVNLNRGRVGTSRRIIWSLFLGSSVLQWLAIENVHMPNSSGYTMRGAAADNDALEDSGPIRFQATRRTCLSAVDPTQATQCSGFKLWNHVSRLEVIDNVFDFQPEAFEVMPRSVNTFAAVAQCSQDMVFRNNEILDARTAFIVGFDEDGCTRDPRPVRDVVIDQNRIVIDYNWGFSGCLTVNGCLDPTRTVQDVTYTNNFCSISGDNRQMIYLDCAPQTGPNPGRIVIAGNTFHAATDIGALLRQGVGAASCTAFVEDDVVFKNNVFVAPPGSDRLVLACELPSFTSDFNTYSAGAEFQEAGARFRSLAEWQTATGQDMSSRECTAAMADAARHDLHLAPADVCARGRGTDLSSEVPLLGRDVDGDARPRGEGVDIGADEVRRPE